MIKSIKFRIYPDEVQKELLEKQFGCCRFIYNWALDYSIWEYKTNQTNTFKKNWQELLPKIKEYLPWLKTDANSQSLQSELIHLDEAFKRFYKKQGGYPKFKSRLDKQSFAVPQHFQIKDGSLTIPKIKDIDIILSKELDPDQVRNITITKSKTGKYIASICYQTEEELPSKPILDKSTSLGIDLGLKHFAILSSGIKIDNPRFYERAQSKLKVQQQALARKEKGSNNYEKNRKIIALQFEKISNQKSDFLHKQTTNLVCESQGIGTLCVENLNVSGMVKNHKLAKSIASVSWSEFTRQLKYKCEWYGVNYLECDRFAPTSQVCSNCSFRNSELVLSDREWICAACGCIHDRDLNAAKNIVDYAFAKNVYPEDTGNSKPVETVLDSKLILEQRSEKQESHDI